MSISSISSNWAAMLSQYLSLNAVSSNSSSKTSDLSQLIQPTGSTSGDTLELSDSLPPLQYTYNSKGASTDDAAFEQAKKTAAEMYSSMDTDGDSVVSAAEFAAARPKEVTADMANKLYSSMDANGDGTLTQTENETALTQKTKSVSSDEAQLLFQQLAMVMPPPRTAYNDVISTASSVAVASATTNT